MEPVPTPIAVLGGGNLGSAILAGLAAAGVRDLRATTRTAASAARYAGTSVAVTTLEADPDANRTAVRGARVVICGVKPAGMVDLLREIGDAVEPDAVVVSLAVGVPVAALAAALPEGVAVVRAMPNTPVRVREGVIGMSAGPGTGADDLDIAATVFRRLGEVVLLEDDRIDRLAAVSGSGPAYVYFLLERFAQVAVDLGFESADAERIVAQTFTGALALLAETGASPGELRRDVTSPNGTTAAAIAVLEQRDLGGLLGDALAAAVRRAEELSAR